MVILILVLFLDNYGTLITVWYSYKNAWIIFIFIYYILLLNYFMLIMI